MNREFSKYKEYGAYHINAVYPKKFRRYSPWLSARYELPFRLLSKFYGFKASDKLYLDVGCGDGALLLKMKELGGETIGLDTSLDGLQIGRKEIEKRTEKAPLLVRATAYFLPFQDSSFDYVISLELIEHLEKATDYILEVKRVLKPGGKLVFSTPQRLKNAEVQDPFHVHEFAPAELHELLTVYFKKVDIWGYHLDLLQHIYFKGTGIRLFDLFIRLAFKLLGKGRLNPFNIVVRNPSRRWKGLMAVCST